MIKQLDPIVLSFAQSEKDLLEFKKLLDGSEELSEAKEILPFFQDHPHLAAQVGSFHLPHNIDRICREFDLFGNFRCDWAVGDSSYRSYALIEFEDARRDSIFAVGDKYNNNWGVRFERGFSQLVDWFWLLDRYRDNVDFRRRFGEGHVTFHGLLVVGRSQFLTPEQRDRLNWRLDRVSINTHKISCITFDDLYEFLAKRLAFLKELADRGELS